MSWLPGPAHTPASPHASEECNLLGHPQLLSLPNSLPYLNHAPSFRSLQIHICVHNYIYFLAQTWVLFLPRHWHPFPLCVCVR